MHADDGVSAAGFEVKRETLKMTAAKKEELAPTVYRTSGTKNRAIAQFVTIEAANAYVAELIAGGQSNEFLIKMAVRNPIKKAYTKRGVWRESGVRQVNR
jgi:hypothetical protein